MGVKARREKLFSRSKRATAGSMTLEKGFEGGLATQLE
jgi:hypothetical protein